MSYTENTGAQAPSVKIADVVLADLTSAEALAVISLPAQAIIIGGHVYVSEVFNSTSSDAITIGDGADADEYLGSTSVQALGRTALVPTGIPCSSENEKTVKITWTSGGGTPTTGALQVIVMYVEPGRADFFQA